MKLSEIVNRIDNAGQNYSCTIELKDGRTFDGVRRDTPIVRKTGPGMFANLPVQLDKTALDDPDVPTREAEVLVTRDGNGAWAFSNLCVWDPPEQVTVGEVAAVRPDPK